LVAKYQDTAYLLPLNSSISFKIIGTAKSIDLAEFIIAFLVKNLTLSKANTSQDIRISILTETVDSLQNKPPAVSEGTSPQLGESMHGSFSSTETVDKPSG